MIIFPKKAVILSATATALAFTPLAALSEGTATNGVAYELPSHETHRILHRLADEADYSSELRAGFTWQIPSTTEQSHSWSGNNSSLKGGYFWGRSSSEHVGATGRELVGAESPASTSNSTMKPAQTTGRGWGRSDFSEQTGRGWGRSDFSEQTGRGWGRSDFSEQTGRGWGRSDFSEQTGRGWGRS